MEIAYTAHTETCTFLLDAEGICRSVLAASTDRGARGRREGPVRIPSSAERCIGAQYVACLDMREPGGMIANPKPGSQMLFARTEQNGRITLVRTATLLRFEQAAPPARYESGVHARPDDVEDSDDYPTPQAHSYSPYYGEDEEQTTQYSPPTIPFRRESLPPIRRTSSIPPADPQRHSGVVPAGYGPRETIPPPPPTVRDVPSYAPPPSYGRPSYLPASQPPRRPGVVRVSAPFWEAATTPRKRSAR